LGAQIGEDGRIEKVFALLVRLKSEGYEIIKLSKSGRK
jgi:hypothetical protein